MNDHCENACTDSYLVTVVHQDEEEVKAAHDGGAEVDVLFQTLAAVVAPAHRVGGSQDGCASVQGGLEEKETETGSGYVLQIWLRGLLGN